MYFLMKPLAAVSRQKQSLHREFIEQRSPVAAVLTSLALSKALGDRVQGKNRR